MDSECVPLSSYNPLMSILSTHYVVFGIVSMMISNASAHDIHTFQIATGAVFFVEHAIGRIDTEISVSAFALLFLLLLITVRMGGELIKFKSKENVDDAEYMHRLRTEKKYKLPAAGFAISVSGYMCAAMVSFNPILWTIGPAIGNLVMTALIYKAVCVNAPAGRSGNQYSKKIKMMVYQTAIVTGMSVVGIATINTCATGPYNWVIAYTGYPLLHLTMSHCIMLSTQFLVMMRLHNLKRRFSVIGHYPAVVRCLSD